MTLGLERDISVTQAAPTERNSSGRKNGCAALGRLPSPSSSIHPFVHPPIRAQQQPSGALNRCIRGQLVYCGVRRRRRWRDRGHRRRGGSAEAERRRRRKCSDSKLHGGFTYSIRRPRPGDGCHISPTRLINLSTRVKGGGKKEARRRHTI